MSHQLERHGAARYTMPSSGRSESTTGHNRGSSSSGITAILAAYASEVNAGFPVGDCRERLESRLVDEMRSQS